MRFTDQSRKDRKIDCLGLARACPGEDDGIVTLECARPQHRDLMGVKLHWYSAARWKQASFGNFGEVSDCAGGPVRTSSEHRRDCRPDIMSAARIGRLRLDQRFA